MEELISPTIVVRTTSFFKVRLNTVSTIRSKTYI